MKFGQENKKIRAMGYATATILILIGVLSVVIGNNWFGLEVGAIILFFIFLIPAIGIFVYLGCTEDEDEYKNLTKEVGNSKSLKFKAIESFIWLIALAIFFALGFFLNGWRYAWIIFIIAAALMQLIKAFFY